MNELEIALSRIASTTNRGYKTIAAHELSVQPTHVSRWLAGGYIGRQYIDLICELGSLSTSEKNNLVGFIKTNMKRKCRKK